MGPQKAWQKHSEVCKTALRCLKKQRAARRLPQQGGRNPLGKRPVWKRVVLHRWVPETRKFAVRGHRVMWYSPSLVLQHHCTTVPAQIIALSDLVWNRPNGKLWEGFCGFQILKNNPEEDVAHVHTVPNHKLAHQAIKLSLHHWIWMLNTSKDHLLHCRLSSFIRLCVLNKIWVGLISVWGFVTQKILKYRLVSTTFITQHWRIQYKKPYSTVSHPFLRFETERPSASWLWQAHHHAEGPGGHRLRAPAFFLPEWKKAYLLTMVMQLRHFVCSYLIEPCGSQGSHLGQQYSINLSRIHCIHLCLEQHVIRSNALASSWNIKLISSPGAGYSSFQMIVITWGLGYKLALLTSVFSSLEQHLPIPLPCSPEALSSSSLQADMNTLQITVTLLPMYSLRKAAVKERCQRVLNPKTKVCKSMSRQGAVWCLSQR